MTTHGRGGLKRLLLGSVTDQVLRGGTVSVSISKNNRHFAQTPESITFRGLISTGDETRNAQAM